jgi:hypothetical protein
MQMDEIAQKVVDHVLAKENREMREAIKAVYYAAHWTPDRPCDADKLWTDLRDAACLTPGNAPKPQ